MHRSKCLKENPLRPEGTEEAKDFAHFTARRGDTLLAMSRTPFFDSARRLLELGADPADRLTMRHRGSDTVSLRARVGVAAALAVNKRDVYFARWRDLRSVWAETEVDA